MSRYVIVIFGLLMGVLSIILFEVRRLRFPAGGLGGRWLHTPCARCCWSRSCIS